MPEVQVTKQLNTKQSNEEKRNNPTQTEVARPRTSWPNRGWDPFAPFSTPRDLFSLGPSAIMRRFQDEFDRAFGRLSGEGSESFAWNPPIELSERDGLLHLQADLPGLRPEDVKVEVTNNSLIIQGERKYEHEDKERGMYRSERRYGQFYREIPLPEGADTNQVQASFRDGVLEVTMPAPRQARNRRSIPIESGTQNLSARTAESGSEKTH